MHENAKACHCLCPPVLTNEGDDWQVFAFSEAKKCLRKKSALTNRQLTCKAVLALCNKINRLILQSKDVRVLPFSGHFPGEIGGDENRKLCGVSFYGLGLAGYVQVAFSMSFNLDYPNPEFGVIPLENRVVFCTESKSQLPNSVRY